MRLLLGLLAVTALAAQEPLVKNGGFEDWSPAKPAADGTLNGWTLPDPPQSPAGWTLNPSYPGVLAAVDGAVGQRGVRLTGAEGRGGHIYQMIEGLKAGQWYRVKARVRGPGAVMFYEYYTDHMSAPTVLESEGGDRWWELENYYCPGGDGYARSALALTVAGGRTAEFDELVIEPVAMETAKGEPIVLSNDRVRLQIAPNGRLLDLVEAASGASYGVAAGPLPLVQARRGKQLVPLKGIAAEGDRLIAEFVDPEVRVVFRVTGQPSHLLFELVEVTPEVSEVSLELGLRKLETFAGAFNATYDEQFGICFFGTTLNVTTAARVYGGEAVGLRATAIARHGLVGAKMALVAAPRGQWFDAIRDTERANGLPSPTLDGDWNRFSEAVEKSYLFATGTRAEDIPTLIEYAKVGGFGTMILLKNDWLANHGHFDLNEDRYPGGLAGFKAAIDQIKAAGLDAGVHIFGPSISPNDPYVTPVPHDDLAMLPAGELTAAIDPAATTLTVAEKPDLPAQSKAYPGQTLRVGDELIQYAAITEEAPWQFTGCRRGALGTTAAAHPAGAAVRHLLANWGFFLVEPDSQLADEVTDNFAKIVNATNLDLVYFDASDGIHSDHFTRWYYLNKMHHDFYTKFDHDLLYQTSNGTGHDFTWHIVPRSASADGHGDIKGYLDDRWPGILNMGNNLTRADIGWYYWFSEVRPDQLEYVCAKAAGVDGSISMETSREALDRLTQSRQMMEMIGRWEHARADDFFGEAVREQLRVPRRDFRLFEVEGQRRLYEAAYEEPVALDVLDGEQNVWTITNDRAEPVQLGIELLRGTREVDQGAYDSDQARLLEDFGDPTLYLHGEQNPYEKFVVGEGKSVSEKGAVRAGVTQDFALGEGVGPSGQPILVYRASNEGAGGGWGGIGRRFTPPLDLTGAAGIGLWVKGDNAHERLRVQLRDTRGRHVDFTPKIDYVGWRLYTFSFPQTDLDFSQVEYLLFYHNDLDPKVNAELGLSGVKVLGPASGPAGGGRPILKVDDREVRFGAPLDGRQALTAVAPEGATLWPGGMKEGQQVAADLGPLTLAPGEHRVEIGWDGEFGGDLTVLLYRLWPLP